jgi:hypothetical protein
MNSFARILTSTPVNKTAGVVLQATVRPTNPGSRSGRKICKKRLGQLSAIKRKTPHAAVAYEIGQQMRSGSHPVAVSCPLPKNTQRSADADHFGNYEN